MRLWIWGKKGSGDVSMNVHSSIICNSKMWKQSKCPSMDEWKDKLSYILTVEYYLVIKSNEVNLENIVASERSQSQRPHSVWIYLCETSRIGKSVGDKVGWWLPRAGGGGNGGQGWGMTANEKKISLVGVCVMKCSKTDSVQWCEYTRNHWMIYFKLENCIVWELFFIRLYIYAVLSHFSCVRLFVTQRQ